jgi:hypothetical protein
MGLQIRGDCSSMGPTQTQLYGDLDLALSWSEADLPERERTKHVHRLHPYLGKFVPQLVESLLARYVRPSCRPWSPVTTLSASTWPPSTPCWRR